MRPSALRLWRSGVLAFAVTKGAALADVAHEAQLTLDIEA
jgi:hypothetical protein